MLWRDFRNVLLHAGQDWSRHAAARHAAAISFYAILSMAPLLIIGVTISTAFLDSETVRASLVSEARDALGSGAADLFVSIIEHASRPGTSVPATIIAILISLYAGSGLFEQLVDSIEDIWGIQHQGHAVALFLHGRLTSIIVMMTFLVLLLTWLATDSVLGWLARTQGWYLGWPFVSILASTVFVTLVFGLTFKSIPRGRVLWREVWPGAIVAGIGFSLAKFVLSLYFSFSGIASAYGSAGALVVILLWIYYCAQIFFFGVEVTRVVAEKRKPKKAPSHLTAAPPPS